VSSVLRETSVAVGGNAARHGGLSTSAGDPLLDLVAALRERGDLEVYADTHLVTIQPRSVSGFPIRMHFFGGECVVSFGECAQEFDDVAEAVCWVERAVSPNCLLHIDKRGGSPYRWRLEHVDETGGVERLSGGYGIELPWIWPFAARRDYERYSYAGGV